MTEPSKEPGPSQDEWHIRQQQLWRWADSQLVPWGKIRSDDYDFQAWTKDASDEMLNAGCLYEYARESHTFRCWLVLRTKPKPKELCGTIPFLQFKPSSVGYDYLWETGWGKWLDNFVNELVSNQSFAELRRTKLGRLQESLDAIPSYRPFPKAVELARGDSKYPGLQIVHIRICWRDYSNADISSEMKELAKKIRPDEWKEPQRRGRGKATSVIAMLDALSALRLASHHPKSLRSAWVPKNRQKDQHESTTAIDIFDSVRLGKIGGVLIHTDLEEYVSRARRQFAYWFPFGEAPANGITWAMRQRRKH
jgi:hypothetical protein